MFETNNMKIIGRELEDKQNYPVNSILNLSKLEYNKSVKIDKKDILDVLDRMIKENKVRVKVLPTTAKWFGATYREDLDNIKNSIKELVAEGAYNENLWS